MESKLFLFGRDSRLRKRFAALLLCSLERVEFLLLTSHLRGNRTAIPIGKLVTARSAGKIRDFAALIHSGSYYASHLIVSESVWSCMRLLGCYRLLGFFSFDADQREGWLLAQVSTPTVIPMNCHTLIPSMNVPLLLCWGISTTIDLTLMVNQFQAFWQVPLSRKQLCLYQVLLH